MEHQSAHRQEMERMLITTKTKNSTLGIWVGGSLCLAVMIFSCILALLGQGTTAAIMAGADMASIAGVFVYGTVTGSRERKRLLDQKKTEKQPL